MVKQVIPGGRRALPTPLTPAEIAQAGQEAKDAALLAVAPVLPNPAAPTTEDLKAAWFTAALKIDLGDALNTTSTDVRYHVELPDYLPTGTAYLEVTGTTLEVSTAFNFTIKSIFSFYCFNGVLSRIEHFDVTGGARSMGVYIHSVTGNPVIWFDAGNFFTTFGVRGRRVGNGQYAGQTRSGVIHVTEMGVTL